MEPEAFNTILRLTHASFAGDCIQTRDRRFEFGQSATKNV